MLSWLRTWGILIATWGQAPQVYRERRWVACAWTVGEARRLAREESRRHPGDYCLVVHGHRIAGRFSDGYALSAPGEVTPADLVRWGVLSGSGR